MSLCEYPLPHFVVTSARMLFSEATLVEPISTGCAKLGTLSFRWLDPVYEGVEHLDSACGLRSGIRVEPTLKFPDRLLVPRPHLCLCLRHFPPQYRNFVPMANL